jgi:hypothetical protein
MVHTFIGPYKILRELAEDRVGRVFEAVDSTRKKSVVIKCLRPDLASQPEAVSRLYSKAETLALLNHEHIARLFGFIRRDDGLFLVMESVNGESLESLLQEKRRLDLAVALAFFRQILSAVQFAHQLGVVHGELKPANVIVTDFARIKVLDFVIATILGNPDPALPPTPYAARYMSPEQLRGEPIDPRSDIYSLGILCYELVVGKTPFEGVQDEFSKRRAQSTPLPPSLVVRNIPPWLDAFLLRALALSPTNRFQSVAAMSRAIESALKATPSRRAPARAFLPGHWQVKAATSRSVDNKAAKKHPGRLSVAFAKTADAIRQKQAGVRHTVRRGLERTNPLLWTRRAALNLSTLASPICLAIKGAPLAATRALKRTARQTISSAQQKTTGLAVAFQRGAAALNPVLLVRKANVDLRDRRRSVISGLKEIQKDVARLPASLRRHYSSFSNNPRRNYALVGILLASIVTEIVILGRGNGNMVLNWDFRSKPLQNPTGAIARVAQPDGALTPISVPDSKPQPPAQPKIIKRSNRTERSLEKPRSGTDKLDYQALESPRTVTYRTPRVDSENQPRRPQAPQVSELVQRSETSTAKTQLNVTWEN